MNDNEKQFENFVRGIKFDDTPDNSHRDRLEQDLLADLARQNRQKEQPLIIWRTIMKSNITKLAIAATIILIAVLSITILDRSTTPAWAIEQTIEALKRFNAVHISGTITGDFTSSGAFNSDVNSQHGFNLWARANQDHTQSSDFWLETDDGQVRWVQGNDTYHYNANQNKVHIIRGQKVSISPWIGPDLLQTLERLTENWEVLYATDPATGRDRVIVTCSHPHAPGPKSWQFEFDLETRLPVSFKQWHNLYREGSPNFDAHKIIYYEDLPDKLFEFEIPEDAIVTEEFPTTRGLNRIDDPNFGMMVDNMTQDEASIEIVNQYWQAVINANWDFVENIRPAANAEDWKSKYSINPPEELVEVGQPYQQEGCSIGPVVPCTVMFEDSMTRDIKMVIKFREIDGKSSCVIAGTWGKE